MLLESGLEVSVAEETAVELCGIIVAPTPVVVAAGLVCNVVRETVWLAVSEAADFVVAAPVVVLVDELLSSGQTPVSHGSTEQHPRKGPFEHL